MGGDALAPRVARASLQEIEFLFVRRRRLSVDKVPSFSTAAHDPRTRAPPLARVTRARHIPEQWSRRLKRGDAAPAVAARRQGGGLPQNRAVRARRGARRPLSRACFACAARSRSVSQCPVLSTRERDRPLCRRRPSRLWSWATRRTAARSACLRSSISTANRRSRYLQPPPCPSHKGGWRQAALCEPPTTHACAGAP